VSLSVSQYLICLRSQGFVGWQLSEPAAADLGRGAGGIPGSANGTLAPLGVQLFSLVSVSILKSNTPPAGACIFTRHVLSLPRTVFGVSPSGPPSRPSARGPAHGLEMLAINFKLRSAGVLGNLV
jgi:hypothetical protein